MKEYNFDNTFSFKKFLKSLKEINKEYYIINLNNIEIDNFEENINFFGELHFNNCIIKNIYGTFDFNRLILNDCKNLYEINLFSSITHFDIVHLDNSMNKYKTIKISGNYINLNNFYFDALNTQKNLIIVGNFNTNDLLEFYFDCNIDDLKLNGNFNKFIINGNKDNIKIIKNLILNNYYNNFNVNQQYLTIHNIIYKNLNDFNEINNYYENIDIVLDNNEENSKNCKNIIFGGHKLKKNNTNSYSNLKSINCLINYDEFIIEGDFENLNTIFLSENVNSLILKGKFNNDLIIDGIIKETLILDGSFKKISNINGYINKIICKNSICGNFEDFDNVECINNNYICGKFKNLSISFDKTITSINNIVYLCNVSNNCEINTSNNFIFNDTDKIIGNFYNLSISNCKNINLNKINIINSLKLNNSNSLLFNNFNKINELHIFKSNIKELNDTFINLKVLELNDCKDLINIPNTYINLEKLIINDCPKININLSLFNKLISIDGNGFDNIINEIKTKINNFDTFDFIKNFSFLLNFTVL